MVPSASDPDSLLRESSSALLTWTCTRTALLCQGCSTSGALTALSVSVGIHRGLFCNRLHRSRLEKPVSRRKQSHVLTMNPADCQHGAGSRSCGDRGWHLAQPLQTCSEGVSPCPCPAGKGAEQGVPGQNHIQVPYCLCSVITTKRPLPCTAPLLFCLSTSLLSLQGKCRERGECGGQARGCHIQWP